MKSFALTPLQNADLEHLSARDCALLLNNARVLQRAAEPSRMQVLLRGRKLALLCESEQGADAALFRRAATDLGAHVSHVWPCLADLSAPDELEHTAKMLGRLYDAIECQGLPRALVAVVDREAGVPVYDGLASLRHPTARLAALLGDAEDATKSRELVVQTALVSTLS